MADKPTRNARIIWREEKGAEALLFDPDTGETYLLNETSLFIWKLCDGVHSKSQITGNLVDNFEVDEKQAAQDVSVCLRKLREKQFIQY